MLGCPVSCVVTAIYSIAVRYSTLVPSSLGCRWRKIFRYKLVTKTKKNLRLRQATGGVEGWGADLKFVLNPPPDLRITQRLMYRMLVREAGGCDLQQLCLQSASPTGLYSYSNVSSKGVG